MDNIKIENKILRDFIKIEFGYNDKEIDVLIEDSLKLEKECNKYG